jgi:hypothetical protein
MYQYSIPFYGQIILQCVAISHFVYSFIRLYTPELSPLLATANNADVNFYVQVFVWRYIFYLLGSITRSGIAEALVILYLTF